MNNTKTLAIVAVLTAATLVVGLTFSATMTQSALAGGGSKKDGQDKYVMKGGEQDGYKKKGNQANGGKDNNGSNNGNTNTIQILKQKAKASGKFSKVEQNGQNMICTHPDNNVPCSQQGVITPTPPPTNSFTITGTGTGSSASFVCNPPVPPGLTISIDFSAQRDGTVSGTYTISASSGFFLQGTITDGTTDGNTYTLSGVNLAVCADNQGNQPVAPMTISGDCGDGVTITYRDPNTVGTFTGNVQCTLT
jgi:hypothetical protein